MPAKCDPEIRFWRKVRFAPNGCWEWTGSTNRRGYGEIRLGVTRKVYAHRFAYERTIGELAAGDVVMHSCDNPKCVRVAHLEAGTQWENMQDAKQKGRMHIAPKKTHCIRGHAFTVENTARGKGGTQRCRECDNARRRKPNGRGPYRRRAA